MTATTRKGLTTTTDGNWIVIVPCDCDDTVPELCQGCESTITPAMREAYETAEDR